MPVFRRRTETAPAQRPPQPVKPGGKGRPTPKRKEAEKRRRQYITAPRDRKEAYRRFRERQAEQRRKIREGMRRGDERYLPKRDRGPVRRFARDYVDGRRTVGSYLMYVMFVIMLLSFIRTPITALLTLLALLLLPPILLLEGLWISVRVKRLATERFPNEDCKGVGLYAAIRAMQIRQLRIPAPQVKPGERVEARGDT